MGYCWWRGEDFRVGVGGLFFEGGLDWDEFYVVALD
jgi:hypothetical protein